MTCNQFIITLHSTGHQSAPANHPCAGFNLEEIKRNILAKKKIKSWQVCTQKNLSLILVPVSFPQARGCVQLNQSEKADYKCPSGMGLLRIFSHSPMKFWTCNSTNSSTELKSTDLRPSCNSGWTRMVASSSIQSWEDHSFLWAVEFQSITFVLFDQLAFSMLFEYRRQFV